MWHARDLTAAGALRLGASVAAPLPAPAATGPEARDRLVFELAPAAAMAAVETAWTDLAARALEPNLFFEPEFALPATAHLYGARKPSFALVWQTDAAGARLRLLALLPLRPWPRLGFARAAVHRYAALGVPLIDRDHAPAALAHLLAGVGAALPHVAGLILPEIPVDGPICALLAARAAAAGRRLCLIERYERAALRATPAAPTPAGSPKRRKNLRRQRRRLGDAGVLTYRAVTDATGVRAATECFLALEARGWKGRRGSAFLSVPGATRFVRAVTDGLARAGRCRIDSLDVDGRAVAMGLVLASGNRAYFWKTAYDEAYAATSPGVQLALELTRTQLGRAGVELTDSCATADHPMINGIWSDRLQIATVAIPLRRRAGLAVTVERLARAGRRLAKRTLAGLRKSR